MVMSRHTSQFKVRVPKMASVINTDSFGAHSFPVKRKFINIKTAADASGAKK